MNVKEYISSGILESYASGELSPAERLEVEKNLALHPELRQELALVESTIEAFLQKAGRQPRQQVKNRILEKVTASKPAGKVVALHTGNVWKYATAASIAIALTSSIMAYTFWQNWRDTKVTLEELRAMNTQVAQDYNTVNQRLDAMENELQIMDNPEFTRVMMSGTDNAPEALAAVYWNRSTSEVYLRIQNLKSLAKDQQYQLWAIVDGKPVDMGVFDGPADGTAIAGLHKMNSTGTAAAFAVTIEPRGGKPTPSMETMQVIGKT